MNTESLSIEAANGGTTAFVAMPDGGGTKAVLVIQEYWGLNDHVKDITGRYANEGFIGIAPDLYRGKIATNPSDASAMMQALAIEDGIEMIANTVAKAAEAYGISHFGITGYCMGGTYALRAACEVEGFSAAVPFYGDIPPEDILSKLRTPTIFISATRDAWINPEKVATLEDAAERFELPVQSLKYNADHAFFNDTRADVFDATAAADAWAAAIALFKEKL